MAHPDRSSAAAALTGVRGWLLDVEGTLVVDKRYDPIPGACEWLGGLKSAGHAVRILTNNTTLTCAELAAELRRQGFAVADEEIISAQRRATEILRGTGLSECWVLGSEALRRTLVEEGFRVRDLRKETPPPVERNGDVPGSANAPSRAFVLGYLDDAGPLLLGRALELLHQPGTRFLALHKNRLFKNRGRMEPGLGAWVAALEYASGVTATVAGKPSPELFLSAARSLGAPHAEIAMVGDDPQSDLAPARGLGMKTVMVLSGKYQDRALLQEVHPDLRVDLVAGSVAEIPFGPPPN